jgi:hypothetical protein
MSTRFEIHIDALANEIGLRFSPRTDYNSRAARIFQQFYPHEDNETIDAVVTLTHLYYSDPVAYDAILSDTEEMEEETVVPNAMEVEPEKEQQTRMTLRSHARAARGMLLRSGRSIQY